MKERIVWRSIIHLLVSFYSIRTKMDLLKLKGKRQTHITQMMNIKNAVFARPGW